MHNIRVKSSVSFSKANNDLSDVEFAIDELRETSDMRIDEWKAMLEASYRDRVRSTKCVRSSDINCISYNTPQILIFLE